MYGIDEPLRFGKYEGFTINDIFTGQRHLSQQFINDFLTTKLKDLTFTVDSLVPGEYCDVEVKNFEVLANNYLSFDLIYNHSSIKNKPDLSESAFINLTAEVEFNNDSKEFYDIYGSPNDFILELNNVKGTTYKPSADPDYVEWCINNLNIFCLSRNDLINLPKTLCNHFYGVSLYKAPWGSVYKYEVIQRTKDFQFKQTTIDLNDSKLSNISRRF